MLAVQGPALASQIRLSSRVEVEDAGQKSFEIEILAEEVSDDQEFVERRMRTLVGESFTIDPPADTTWRLSAVARGFWS